YAAAGRDSAEIGRKLEVEAVLDGRVQRAGDQIRLTVQLLRTVDGAPLWAGSFDGQSTNLLTVQKTISEEVAQALTVKLSAEQQRRLKKDYTANTAAFDAYMRGRYFWGKQNRESVTKAIGYFQQAIEIDPTYALAWAGIADSYATLGIPVVMMGMAPQNESINKARAAAERAVELDETLPEAHVALGAAFIILNDAGAHREFERALELNPNLAAAHHYYGLCLLGDGRPAEALPKIERARELDPLSVLINTNVGVTLYRLRRYDEAGAQLRKTLEMDQSFIRARWALGLVYEQQRRFAEAVAELQQAEQLSGGGAVALSALGHVYAVTGRRAEAEQMLTRLFALREQNLASPYHVAAVYAGLGDKEQTFAWLEKVRGTGSVTVLRMDQHFDPLREDSRFADLLRQ
ncbi:MAG TPA: tetratricopeptide repeat protein, partial [Blastocatellia bacterium]|nr:tetratricopeptide repeat protein [Blastocatellia bacterium]